MRVEVDQAHGAMLLGDRPQLAEANAVVPRDRAAGSLPRQDPPQAGRTSPGSWPGCCPATLPGRRGRLPRDGQNLDLLLDVVRAANRREASADRARPNRPRSGSWPVSEGMPTIAAVDPGHVIHLGQAHEAADAGEARPRTHRVHRPVHLGTGELRFQLPSCSPRE